LGRRGNITFQELVALALKIKLRASFTSALALEQGASDSYHRSP
jgi:hypothetical protein